MKIRKIILTIFILFIFLISLLQMEFSFDKTIKKVDNVTVLQKDKSLKNEKYISLLEKLSSKYDVSIMVEGYEIYNKKPVINYYISDNNSILNNNFFVDYSSDKINKDNYITNLKTYNKNKVGTLRIPQIFSSYKLLSLDSLLNENLDSNVYYLRGTPTNIAKFKKELIDNKIYEEEYNASINYDNYNNIIYLFFLIIFINLFFIIVKKDREWNIKFIHGYSKKKLLFLESKKFNLEFLKNLVVLLIIGSIFLMLYDKNILLTVDYMYFKNSLRLLLILNLMYIVIMYLFVNFTNKTVNKIKGQNNSKIFLFISYIFKVLIIIFLIIMVSSSFRDYKVATNLFKQQTLLVQKVNDYVTIPINTKGIADTDENTAKEEEAMIKFYELTENNLKGVLINSRNYRTISGEKNSCEEFLECDIQINENYLDINPIKYEGKIEDNKVNVLVPNGFENYSTIENNLKSDNINDNEINYLKYDKNNKFYLFNQYSKEDSGYITNPVAYIINDKYISMNDDNKYIYSNAISGGYYFVKTKTENPYKEVEPYLKDAKLKTYVKETPYIKDNYLEQFNLIKNALIKSIILVIFYLILIIILLSYSIYFIIEISKEKFIINFLMGIKKIKMFKFLIILYVLEYLLYVIISAKLNINIIIPTVIIILELIFTYLNVKNYLSKNIIEYLKGD